MKTRTIQPLVQNKGEKPIRKKCVAALQRDGLQLNRAQMFEKQTSRNVYLILILILLILVNAKPILTNSIIEYHQEVFYIF